jgi:hypothetical protein
MSPLAAAGVRRAFAVAGPGIWERQQEGFAMVDIAVERTEPAFEQTGFRLSWGAIFAGFFVALTLHFVLALLGAAIGLAAWDPDSPGGIGGGEVAAGLGIWAALSALVALFIGGATTGRLAGILRRSDGMLHGVVLWAVTTVAILWLVASGVGMVLGGAFRVAGAATGVATQAVGAAAPEVAGPALTATVRGEERDVLVSRITQQTQLSRAEAEQVVSDVEQTQQQIAAQIDTLAERAPAMAAAAAGTASRAAWWTLLALGLSLGAAVFGARTTARE